MDYQINITFDEAGLEQIYQTGSSVVLVKSVNTSPASATMPIAWIASRQPLMNNAIAREEGYALYATSGQIMPGMMIEAAVEAPANTGSAYTFDASSQFAATGSSSVGTIALTNASSEFTSFGLVQYATVNGMSMSGPTNVSTLPSYMNATYTPTETVALFIYQVARSGQVFSSIPGNALVVTLSSANPTANVTYNSSTNMFFCNRDRKESSWRPFFKNSGYSKNLSDGSAEAKKEWL